VWVHLISGCMKPKSQQDNSIGRDSSPSTSSHVEPTIGVQFLRELRDLLKPHREGPSDEGVCLSGGLVRELFGASLPQGAISLDEARQFPCVVHGEYLVWPIFATPAYQNSIAAIFNKTDLEGRFPDYFPSVASSIRGSIGEAVRNVGQHGVSNDRRFHCARFGECLFASAALLARELTLTDEKGTIHRALIAVVTDQGRGIYDPERSMVDGVGIGEDYEGMGVELQGSLVYLITSARREWSLFQGGQGEERKPHRASSSSSQEVSADARIPRIGAVDLPVPTSGCQKVLIFAHPAAPKGELQELRGLLLGALRDIAL
jgi:hypothetical protein